MVRGEGVGDVGERGIGGERGMGKRDGEGEGYCRFSCMRAEMQMWGRWHVVCVCVSCCVENALSIMCGVRLRFLRVAIDVDG